MFWLDGSSNLPFKFISLDFAGKIWVEDSAKILAEIEVQAEIAKSLVKIGNFDHWCHTASKLVDLVGDLIYMELDCLYIYKASISRDEKLRRFSELDSQLKDSICHLTFEFAHRRLFANNLISINSDYRRSLLSTITSISSTRNSLVNLAKRGDAGMIASLPLSRRETPTAGPFTSTTSSTSGYDSVPIDSTPTATPRANAGVTTLPRHGFESPPALTTITTTSLGNPPPLVSTSARSTRASDVPNGVPLPRHRPPSPHPPTPTSTTTSCNHERWSSDRLARPTRVTKERVEENGREEGGGLKTEEKKVGEMEKRRERKEMTKAGGTSKPPPPPSTSNHKRGQGNSDERHKQ